MKKILITLITFIIFITVISPVSAQENAIGIVVKFRENMSMTAAVDSVPNVKSYNNTSVDLTASQFKPLYGSYYLLKNKNIPVDSLIAALKKSNAVEYVERDYNLTLAATPNDSLYSSQYYLPKMSAAQAWDKTTGSNSVIVAVVDSGVDYNHPDLASNMWRNSSGQVGYDFGENDTDPMDTQGHGTHMAGVIGAVGNNGAGITGINWNVKIMAVKVIGTNALQAPTSTVASGIRYAADNGAKVINMSFGAPGIYSQTIVDAINYAWSKGAVIVASSGNYICPSVWFPANQPNVLAAGAVDANDVRPSFSCSGDALDLSAPSVGIVTTERGGTYTSGSGNTGTSYSAAMVSGAAALVFASQPSLNNNDVVYRLQTTADDLGSTGKDNLYGYGRINLARAVQSTSVTPTVTVTPTPTTTIIPTITPYPTATLYPYPTITPYPTATLYPYPSPTPSVCVYKTTAQIKDENGAIINVSGTNVGLRLEYKFTANNGQYYEGSEYFTNGQNAKVQPLEAKFQNIMTTVILHQDRNVYDLQESRTFCYDKTNNKSCRYNYAQTVQAQLVCGAEIEYGWVVKKRNFEPMPTIIYPTATPQPGNSTLQIYPNVGAGASVRVGQIIKVCYKVPQAGQFTFTTITDSWQTNRTYRDDGTGDCLTRQIVNPIGRHTYRITMNGQTAETHVVVSGNYEPGSAPNSYEVMPSIFGENK